MVYRLCSCLCRCSPASPLAGGILHFWSVLRVPVQTCVPVLSLPSPRRPVSSKSHAFDAAELPAFLKTGADTGYLLSVGAKQPREKSLNLAGVARRYSSPITTFAHKWTETISHIVLHLCSSFSVCLHSFSHFHLTQIKRASVKTIWATLEPSRHSRGLRVSSKVTVEALLCLSLITRLFKPSADVRMH